MSELAELIIQISIPLVLILLGLFVGSTTESLHFKSLERREKESTDLLVTELRSYPRAAASPSREARMIVCEVVIATDYLKSFLAALKKLIGGEVKSYLSLVERARREAILRVLEEARRQGYNAVCNIRLVASDIGGSAHQRKGAAMVTLIASGTAYQADL